MNMQEQPLFEIGLRFDEWIDPTSQEKKGLQEVADFLITSFPQRVSYDLSLNYGSEVPRGLLVAYSRLVGVGEVDKDQHVWLLQMKQQGYIQDWKIYSPGTWKEYFQSRSEDQKVIQFSQYKRERG